MRSPRARIVAAPPRAGLGARRRPVPPPALVAAGRARRGRHGARLDARADLRARQHRARRLDGWRRTSEPRRRRWAQELEGTPFERLFDRNAVEARLDQADGGTRGDAELRPAAARASRAALPFMLRAADAPRSSTRPSTAWRRRWNEPPRAGLLGLGRAGRRAVAARARARRSCGPSSASSGAVVVDARWRSRTCGCASRRCPPALRERLRGDLAPRVRDDREARVLRAAGKSYLDLLAQRAGDCEDAPDAVVAPRVGRRGRARCCRPATRRTSRSCRSAAGRRWSAAWRPSAAAARRWSSLDLGALDAVSRSTSARCSRGVGPGLRLPEADARSRAHGLTLGHFPQSYEWATVGGCVATRSAGQASTGFGRIEENVVALRLAAPARRAVSTRETPASAAGPPTARAAGRLRGRARRDHRGLAARAPAARASAATRAASCRSSRRACEVLRALAQDERRARRRPPVRRGGDARVARARRPRARLGSGARRRRCLLICGWEGRRARRRRRREAARRLRRAARRSARGGPGAWLASRYAGPHLRDDLMDRGVLVETLETATTWSRPRRRCTAAVTRALDGPARRLPRLPRLPDRRVALLHASSAGATTPTRPASGARSRRAACDAIVAAGGTITHHHAVGRDHAPWLAAEDGRLGVELLRAVKERLDPAGIMNPGKLLPA